MIPEIGHYSLIMALCLAIVQAIFPLWGTYTHRAPWIYMARSTAYGQFLFIAISFLILAYALLTNDFSLAYVAQNSNSHLPAIYRFCATWGAHEGSLLLWVLILSIWTVLIAKFNHSMSLVMQGRVLSVLAMISTGFLLFLLITSDPFQRLVPDLPLDGRDLNPLLQDPGLSIHPPMLYLGYVGFAVAFAFAIAALLSGKFDSDWARYARPWTLAAWGFLTLGITLGSWWAYRVLGWGGWWFWDPVENASFLPWLSGTALVHSLIVAEKRDVFKAWTVLLAVCTFSLSLMGTFLVRSGVLVSVHAFAIDPARGAFMLYFLATVVGGSLALYAWQGHRIKSSGIFQLWSRETLLLTNNVILTSCMLTVLLGTLYPLVIDALGLGKLSVGPPYFNTVFIPLMIPLLFTMGVGPALHWKNANLSIVVSRLKYSLFLSVVFAFLIPWWFTGKVNIAVVIGLLLAFWVIMATLQNSLQSKTLKPLSQRLGMLLAHIGLGVTVIGIVISTAYSVEQDVRMQPHDSLNIGPYRVQFEGVSTYKGANYFAYKGIFQLHHRAKLIYLNPELRIYEVQKMAMAKTAIHARPTHDLYIALGEERGQGAWSMRVYYKPFVRWIWTGGVLMVLGAIVAVVQLRQYPLVKNKGELNG